MTVRFLVVQGGHTALRVALPALGEFTLGSAPHADISLKEPDISPEHVTLFLDHGIGFRSEEDATLVRGGEQRLKAGATVDIFPGDLIRLGDLELHVIEPAPQSPPLALLAKSAFKEAYRGALEGDLDNKRVVRLKTSAPAERLEEALAQHLPPSTVAGDLGGGRYGLVVIGLDDRAVEERLGQVASSLRRHGAELLMGQMRPGEAPKDKLLGSAEERLAPPQVVDRGRFFVAEDPEMQRVLALVNRLASSSAHVLILGETGTGKDRVAQMIHEASSRAQAPFVRINSVDLSDSFLEEAASNFLSRARGGTVHLDEIGGLSTRAQANLGYLLEQAPGMGHDVRFVATSNQDLLGQVNQGTFRKDLYFRLNQVSLVIPPLRQRPGDIVPLAEKFLEEAAGGRVIRLSDLAQDRLASHPWPGNVRELRNVVERALLLCTGTTLGVEHLPAEFAGGEAAPAAETESPKGGSLRDELAALEKRRILEALKKYGTQREAATALDIPMRTFLNRLDALGIPRARGGGQKKGEEEDSED